MRETGDAAGGPHPDQARDPRRRARVLPRELPAQRLLPSSGFPRSSCRTTTPARHTGSCAGMHFQVGEGMAKLVRCARGAILDVVVDLRQGSPTFGELGGVRAQRREPPPALLPGRLRPRLLRPQRRRRRDVQAGAATTTSDSSAGSPTTIPTSAIDWPSDIELKPSKRDANAPRLRDIEAELPFVYEAARLSATAGRRRGRRAPCTPRGPLPRGAGPGARASALARARAPR